MKVLFLNILFLFLYSPFLLGETVKKKEANQFIQNWLVENEYFLHYGKYKNSNQIFELKSIRAIEKDKDNFQYYVAELNPIGFVLLAADDRLNPIIGYSSENNFDFNSANDDFFLTSIFRDLENNFANIKQKKAIQKNVMWKTYSVPNTKLHKPKNKNEILGPFLNSDWGQGFVNGKPVFNYYAPNQWPTGCVATATAQILNYYKWPYQGNGSNGYSDNGKYLFVNFEKTFYNWENTLDLYKDQPFNLDNQKAAGLLTYHTAVALEMDFEYNGSTASTPDVPNILHNYFRASGHYKSESTDGFWEAMKNNMLDERPAIISIKSTQHSVGHAAVVDGYFSTNNYYHVNPGWYGSSTGWYNISGSWDMGSYDIVVGAAKGIVPSPQINEIERLSENSFNISWKTSRHQNADYYELQQAKSISGPWTTISNNLVDSIYTLNNIELGSYFYKVRVNRDSIWWDYSEVKKVQLGTERVVTFQVDMSNTQLDAGDTLVIRGNTPPLLGNIDSSPMKKNDTSNVYKLSLSFDYDYVGKKIIYRFFIRKNNGLVAESENREYVLTSDPLQVLPSVYFDNLVGLNKNKKLIPSKFSLMQNFPNPFNPSTVIKYQIPITSLVSLNIYNSLGQNIKTLINKIQLAGSYNVHFEANNIPSGIYFYQIKTNNFTKTKKMILIK